MFDVCFVSLGMDTSVMSIFVTNGATVVQNSVTRCQARLSPHAWLNDMNMTDCKQAKINLTSNKKNGSTTLTVKFSWRFLPQRDPSPLANFRHDWFVKFTNLPARWQADYIIIWEPLPAIHLFESAGSLIFFCVDYTFMTQFSAITGLGFLYSTFCHEKF